MISVWVQMKNDSTLVSNDEIIGNEREIEHTASTILPVILRLVFLYSVHRVLPLLNHFPVFNKIEQRFAEMFTLGLVWPHQEDPPE